MLFWDSRHLRRLGSKLKTPPATPAMTKFGMGLLGCISSQHGLPHSDSLPTTSLRPDHCHRGEGGGACVPAAHHSHGVREWNVPKERAGMHETTPRQTLQDLLKICLQASRNSIPLQYGALYISLSTSAVSGTITGISLTKPWDYILFLPWVYYLRRHFGVLLFAGQLPRFQNIDILPENFASPSHTGCRTYNLKEQGRQVERFEF